MCDQLAAWQMFFTEIPWNMAHEVAIETGIITISTVQCDSHWQGKGKKELLFLNPLVLFK